MGVLVAGAATWISSGEAASCKKAGTFCTQKAAATKPAIRKSPSSSSQRGSGVVGLDYTVQGRPSKSPPPGDHGRERDSISPQFHGG